jgi:hypothetical protein
MPESTPKPTKATLLTTTPTPMATSASTTFQATAVELLSAGERDVGQGCSPFGRSVPRPGANLLTLEA